MCENMFSQVIGHDFPLQINVRSTMEERVPSSRHKFRAYLNLLLQNSLAVTVSIIHLHPSEQTQNSSEVTEALPLIMTCFVLPGSMICITFSMFWCSNSKLMLCQWLQLPASSHLQVRCTMLPALRSTWAVKPWVFPHLSSPGKRSVSLF